MVHCTCQVVSITQYAAHGHMQVTLAPVEDASIPRNERIAVASPPLGQITLMLDNWDALKVFTLGHYVSVDFAPVATGASSQAQ